MLSDEEEKGVRGWSLKGLEERTEAETSGRGVDAQGKTGEGGERRVEVGELPVVEDNFKQAMLHARSVDFTASGHAMPQRVGFQARVGVGFPLVRRGRSWWMAGNESGRRPKSTGSGTRQRRAPVTWHRQVFVYAHMSCISSGGAAGRDGDNAADG